jgi:hypothetical protein
MQRKNHTEIVQNSTMRQRVSAIALLFFLFVGMGTCITAIALGVRKLVRLLLSR